MKRALPVAFALALLWVGLAAWHGALGAARNDDWDAYNLAHGLARDGAFRPSGWLAMTFLGQALLAWPLVKLFGATLVPLQLLVATLGAIGLAATYALVRAFLPTRWAVLSVACLALGPIYGSIAVSFMTDVPAFTFQMLALLAAGRALRDADRPSRAWFAISLGLALFAFSIREYAVPAGVAAAAVYLRRTSGRARSHGLLLTAIWCVAIVGVYAWRQQMPTGVRLDIGWMLRGTATVATFFRRAGFNLALFVAPALLAISPLALARAVWRSARLPALLALTSLVAILVVGFGPIAFLGNYMTLHGSYPITLAGDHSPIVPDAIWGSLILLAFVALIKLVVTAALPERRGVPALDQPTSLVATFVTLTIGLDATLVVFTHAPLFDRYLIPVVPLVAALVLELGVERELMPRWRQGLAAVAIVAWGAFGLHYVDVSATFDGTRWRLAQEVAARGLPPETIDGGFEWYGLHHPGRAYPNVPGMQQPFWLNVFNHGPVCASLTLPTTAPLLLGPRIAERRQQSLFGVEVRVTAIAGPQRCAPR